MYGEQPLLDRLWLPFKNDSGYTIPAYGVFHQSQSPLELLNGELIIVGVRASIFPGKVPQFVNGPVEVLDDGYGRCLSPANGPCLAQYSATCGTTPSDGRNWGLIPNSFALWPGIPGYRIIQELDPVPSGWNSGAVYVMQERVATGLCVAIEDWNDVSTTHVNAHPKDDDFGEYDGSGNLPEVTVVVYLPRNGSWADPAIFDGDEFRWWAPGHSGYWAPTLHAVPFGDYLDDKVGTVKFWNLTTGALPVHWRQYGNANEFIRIANSAGAGSAFGTTGTDYTSRNLVCVERFK